MESKFYVPILKSKSGEFMALSKLNSRAKKSIAPLFEVTPLEWDHSEQKKPKTLDDHLTSFCKKFITKWGRDDCFVDVGLLNWNEVDNTHKIEFLYNILHLNGFSPIPVLRVDSSPQFFEALKRTFDLHGISEVSLRVELSDVTSEEFEEKIQELLAKVELEPAQAHLILDLKDANFSEAENFSEGLMDLFENFPSFLKWKSFTIAGTAFPEGSRIKSGLWEFDRNDWKLYQLITQKLGTKDFKRPVNYGDYSIVNPGYFEFNPKLMSASANIRYTHNTKWIVAKGNALKKAADFLQYKKLATDIYNNPNYLGEGFSEGSSYLAKCSRGEAKNGNATTWNWVGNNHHFTKVLFDLFAILPGS